jgi:isopenicillin-N epimerase
MPKLLEHGDWNKSRALFSLDESVAHLNHGSFGAVPIPVFLRQDQLRHECEQDPVAWFRHRVKDEIATARREIARFLKAREADIALVTNASAGVSAVLASFGLREGDEVLRSDHAYGAVSYAIARACRHHNGRVVTASFALRASDEEIVEAFASRLTSRTKLAVIDEITSPTARRLPVAEITRLAHEAGAAVLIDGAHGPGMLPVDLSECAAEFYVGNLHKWACAPRGTAALFVAEPFQAEMESLTVSWGEEEGFPASFDQVGTTDYTAWIAAPSALDLLEKIGWDAIRSHNADLAAYGQAVVAEALGIPLESLPPPGGLAMSTIALPAGVAETPEGALSLQDEVTRHCGAETAIVAFHGEGLLRLSAQIYNTASEYDSLARGLRSLLG